MPSAEPSAEPQSPMTLSQAKAKALAWGCPPEYVNEPTIMRIWLDGFKNGYSVATDEAVQAFGQISATSKLSDTLS